jgi:hypothetical protein
MHANNRAKSAGIAASQQDLEIIFRPRAELKPDPGNPRRHSKKQIRQIANSIRVFGFNVPILIDRDGHVIAGHGRLLACRELGMDEVPTVCLDHLTPEQIRAFRIADNKLTENATQDDRLLAEQLRDLSLTAGREACGELKNVCVWVKDNAGMGSHYRSQHELIFVFKHGRHGHRNNVQLGRFGRNRSNVWHYPGANSFARCGAEGNLSALHPTVKPVAMVADAILDGSARGDIVLDAFLGSGTTVIAAELTGRRCCGLELDPGYVDTAIRRWQTLTGDQA